MNSPQISKLTDEYGKELAQQPDVLGVLIVVADKKGQVQCRTVGTPLFRIGLPRFLQELAEHEAESLPKDVSELLEAVRSAIAEEEEKGKEAKH